MFDPFYGWFKEFCYHVVVIKKGSLRSLILS